MCIYIYIYIRIYVRVYIYIYIRVYKGSAKKCRHTLTKENSMFYVSTNFNYTSQVEYTLQQSTIQVFCTCTVNGGAQSGCR